MEDFVTLNDYLRPGLDIVFVGLNPSQYSVEVGHYFANPRNRFWAALNRSGLVDRDMTLRMTPDSWTSASDSPTWPRGPRHKGLG